MFLNNFEYRRIANKHYKPELFSVIKGVDYYKMMDYIDIDEYRGYIIMYFYVEKIKNKLKIKAALINKRKQKIYVEIKKDKENKQINREVFEHKRITIIKKIYDEFSKLI